MTVVRLFELDTMTLPRVVTVSGIVIDVILRQLLNAPSPMDTTPWGITTSDPIFELEKRESGIVRTVSPKVTSIPSESPAS